MSVQIEPAHSPPAAASTGDRLEFRLLVCAIGTGGLTVIAALAGRSHIAWPTLTVALGLIASAAAVMIRSRQADPAHIARTSGPQGPDVRGPVTRRNI